MSHRKASETTRSWNSYWRATADIGAFSADGVAHPDIRAFWSELFSSAANQGRGIQLLDIATGNGTILDIASSILDAESTSMTCVDISPAAIENVAQRFPGTTGIVADALSIPLENETYNLVTSQFGVEYAGLAAVNEAARLVARNGHLALMMHVIDSMVYKECVASLAAIEKLQAANFMPLAIAFFQAGFAAVRGADRSAYDAAGRMFAPAIRTVETIMADFGEGVAGHTIARLYSDVERMHNSLPNFEPDDVLGWLSAMDSELRACSDRMSSMIEAAISATEFKASCEYLEAQDFVLRRSHKLYTRDRKELLAWIIVATR